MLTACKKARVLPSDAATAQLNVPNPLGRYSRVLATSVGEVTYSVTSVLGPLRHIVPS